MHNIAAVDANLKVESTIKEQDIVFYDVNQQPFRVYGVFYEDGKFRRLPEKVAKAVNDGVYHLHANTAGGRVRFQTDSAYVAIRAKMPDIHKMPRCALTGSAGFDLYVRDDGEKYVETFVPPISIRDGYESVIYFPSEKMREITINFPLYSDVSQLHIGVSSRAEICPPTPYKTEKPIVYYGSSITQGGFASRPGNAYESVISRRFSCDYVNLGFAGSARGEEEMAEYISGLDMAAFVYDYDHNAPSVEHFQNTHDKMFRRIRKAHPDLPVIMMSRPKFYLTEEERQYLEVIQATYSQAKERGDENVYILDGPALMALAADEGTVDNVHPNDLGFASMAKAVGDILETILSE